MEAFLESCGPVITAEALTLPRSGALAALLLERDDLGAELVEIRSNDNAEWLIVEVSVDLGQLPVNDIRALETVAIGFARSERDWPAIAALRPDFPRGTEHQFLAPADMPASLCLTERPWAEARRRWSPADQIRLLRSWLIDTARGALHRPDQPLEPFLPVASTRLVLPPDTFARAAMGERMEGSWVGSRGEEHPTTIRLSFKQSPGSPNLVAAAIGTAPIVHGAIRHPPRTLADLLDLLRDDPAFATALDSVIGAWVSDPRTRKASPLLLVQFPMIRQAGGEVERCDQRCLLLSATVEAIAVSLGLWAVEGGGGSILPILRPPGPYGADISISIANPVHLLDATAAAAYSARVPSGALIAAIGAGALGSQVLLNLARMGETPVAVIDEDRLLPHNLARHAASSDQLIGWRKADVAQWLDTETRWRPEPLQAISADVTSVDDADLETVRSALEPVDVVLDMAASVAVSRRLSLDSLPGGRRISLFLSPTGRDLVVLAEDRERSVRLDHLEMGYYAQVAKDPALAGHFDLPQGQRYARSCREVSVQIPQSWVALHAAIATDVILKAIATGDSIAAVWRIDPATMTVSGVGIEVPAMSIVSAGGWELHLSGALVEQLRQRRIARLPSETGGVLLGDFDLEHRIVYLVASIDAPPDSVETPSGFVRGIHGLQQAIADIVAQTHGALDYVGEWHSHPEGVEPVPSGEDAILFAHMAEAMLIDSHPAIMLIVGDEDIGIVVGDQRINIWAGG